MGTKPPARTIPNAHANSTAALMTRKKFVYTASAAIAAMMADGRLVLPHLASGSALAAGKPVGVTEIADGVFAHAGHHALYNPENKGDIANASFIVGDEAVAVVDTSGSNLMGAELRAAIARTTDRPVRYVINTHMHPDHVFGNAAFLPDKPEFVAHHKMARGLAARADRYLEINREALGPDAFAGTQIVLPTTPVEDEMQIDLGNRLLTLSAQPTAHTDNDLIVRDERTGTLFLGDLLFSGHVPTLDGSIKGWLAVLEDLQVRPAQRVVPGHGPASMPWPDALTPQIKYLRIVIDEVRTMIRAGKTLSDTSKIAGHSQRDAWLLFDEYHVRTVSAAYAELEWE